MNHVEVRACDRLIIHLCVIKSEATRRLDRVKGYQLFAALDLCNPGLLPLDGFPDTGEILCGRHHLPDVIRKTGTKLHQQLGKLVFNLFSGIIL